MSSCNEQTSLAIVTLVVLATAATAVYGEEIVERTFQLENRLTVALRQVPQSRVVDVRTYFAAGSCFEPDTLAGLAHLTEHLLTESSHRHPHGELARDTALYSLAANASTSPHSMSFYATCLPRHLERILQLEAGRMTGVAIDSTSFLREEKVVKAEISLRARRSYDDELVEEAFRLAYPNHPLGRDVVGTHESVTAITLTDVEIFAAQRIGPADGVLVVTGPDDVADMEAIVQRVFADISGGAAVARALPIYPDPVRGQRVLDSTDHDGYRWMVSGRIPIDNREDILLTKIVLDWLDHFGLSVRARDVPGETVFFIRGGYSYYRPPPAGDQAHWGVMHSPFDPDRDVQSHLGWTWERIRTAASALNDSVAFEEVKAELRKRILRTAASEDRIDAIGEALLQTGQFMTQEEYLRGLDGVSALEVRHHLVTWITPETTNLCVSHGRDSERIVASGLAKRRRDTLATPAADPLATVSAEVIDAVLADYRASGLVQLHTANLPNGTPVLVHKIPESRQCYVSGLRTYPLLKDCRRGKRPGITLLYNSVVNTLPQSGRDDDPFHDWPFAVRLQVFPGEILWSCQSSVAEADEACAALARRLASKEFNTLHWSSYSRRGDIWLADISSDPDRRAAAWLVRQCLGEETAAAAPMQPDPQTATRMKYKDLQKIHDEVARRTGNTVIWVSGGLDRDEAVSLLSEHLRDRKDWESRKPPAPVPRFQGVRGAIFTAPERGDVFIHLAFPLYGADQPRDCRTGARALVLDAVLTTALRSRLREQAGFTYTIGARHRSDAGIVQPWIWLSCQPGQGPRTLATVVEELARLATSGPTDNEIARGRLELVKRMTKDGGAAGYMPSWLEQILRTGEPESGLLDDPVALVLTTDAAAIREMFGNYTPPDAFAYAVIGPVLEEDLELYEEAIP